MAGDLKSLFIEKEESQWRFRSNLEDIIQKYEAIPDIQEEYHLNSLSVTQNKGFLEKTDCRKFGHTVLKRTKLKDSAANSRCASRISDFNHQQNTDEFSGKLNSSGHTESSDLTRETGRYPATDKLLNDVTLCMNSLLETDVIDNEPSDAETLSSHSSDYDSPSSQDVMPCQSRSYHGRNLFSSSSSSESYSGSNDTLEEEEEEEEVNDHIRYNMIESGNRHQPVQSTETIKERNPEWLDTNRNNHAWSRDNSAETTQMNSKGRLLKTVARRIDASGLDVGERHNPVAHLRDTSRVSVEYSVSEGLPTVDTRTFTIDASDASIIRTDIFNNSTDPLSSSKQVGLTTNTQVNMQENFNQTPEKASPTITLTQRLLEEFNKSVMENENMADQSSFNVSQFSQSKSPVKFDRHRSVEKWLSKVDSLGITYLVHQSKDEGEMQLNRDKVTMQKDVKCTPPVRKEPRKSSFEWKEPPIFKKGTVQTIEHETEGRHSRQHDTEELDHAVKMSGLENDMDRVREMTSCSQNTSLDINEGNYYSSQPAIPPVVDLKGLEALNEQDFKCSQKHAFFQQKNVNPRDFDFGNKTNYDSGYPNSIRQDKTYETLEGRHKQTNPISNSYSELQAALDTQMNTTFDIKTSVFNNTTESVSHQRLPNYIPNIIKDQNCEKNNNSKATSRSLRKPKTAIIGKQPPPIKAALFRKIRTSELVKMLKAPQIATFLSPKLNCDDDALESDLEMELYTIDKCEHEDQTGLAGKNVYNTSKLQSTYSGKNEMNIDDQLPDNRCNQYTVQHKIKDHSNVYATHSDGRKQGSFDPRKTLISDSYIQQILHRMQENAPRISSPRLEIQNVHIQQNNLEPDPSNRNITAGFQTCEKTNIVPVTSKIILSTGFIEQRSAELGSQRTISLGSPVIHKKMACNEGRLNSYTPSSSSRSFRTPQNLQMKSSDKKKGGDSVIGTVSEAGSMELDTQIHMKLHKKALEPQLQKIPRVLPLFMVSEENVHPMHFVLGEKLNDVDISKANVHHDCTLETPEFDSETGIEAHCRVVHVRCQQDRLRPYSSPVKPGKSRPLKTQDPHNEERTPSKPRPKTSVSFKDRTEDAIRSQQCDVTQNLSAIPTQVKRQIPLFSKCISPKGMETSYKSQKEPESGQKYLCSSTKASATSQVKHPATMTHFIEISSKNIDKGEFRNTQKQKPYESRMTVMSPDRNLDVYSFSKHAESPATSLSKLRLQTSDDSHKDPVSGHNSVQSRLQITHMTSQPAEAEKGNDQNQTTAGKSRKNLFRVPNAVQLGQRPINMKVAHPSTLISQPISRTGHNPKQQCQLFMPSGHSYNYAQSTPVRPGMQFNLDETLSTIYGVEDRQTEEMEEEHVELLIQ